MCRGGEEKWVRERIDEEEERVERVTRGGAGGGGVEGGWHSTNGLARKGNREVVWMDTVYHPDPDPDTPDHPTTSYREENVSFSCVDTDTRQSQASGYRQLSAPLGLYHTHTVCHDGFSGQNAVKERWRRGYTRACICVPRRQFHVKILDTTWQHFHVNRSDLFYRIRNRIRGSRLAVQGTGRDHAMGERRRVHGEYLQEEE